MFLIKASRAVQFRIVVFVWQFIERFLRAQRQDPEVAQTVIDQSPRALPQFVIEAAEYVPTDDYLKLVERAVGCQIVLRKHYVLLERRVDKQSPALPFEVVFQRSPSPCLQITRGKPGRRRSWKTARTSLSHHFFTQIGCIDPRSLIEVLFFKQDGEGIDFLS